MGNRSMKHTRPRVLVGDGDGVVVKLMMMMMMLIVDHIRYPFIDPRIIVTIRGGVRF